MSARSSFWLRTGSRAAAGVALTVVAAFLFSLAGSVAAEAADAVLPDGPKTLVVHPGEAPASGANPGDGLPRTSGSAASPEGHTFEARLVPGFDLRKTVDWNRAVALTAGEAAPLVAAQPVLDATRSGDGTSVFTGLETGLYLVEETSAPAGVVRSRPFLVTLPLPHPTAANEWLSTVHVYPKNAAVEVALEVLDHAAVSCGDTVTWTALNAIPALDRISQYRVQNLLADDVIFNGKFGDVVVEITGQPALVAAEDYVITEIEVDGRWGFETSFTAKGLTKLAVDTDARVRISYDTHVVAAGEFTNEVRLFAGDAGAVTDTATTKFGPLRILVHEKGNPSNLIEGADFRLYLSEADARAGRNPIVVAGVTDFRTDGDGLITIACLRFSNFADGLDREPGAEHYRDYFAKPVSYPAGWTGEDVILRGSVTSATEPMTLRAVVWKGVTPPVLSETGARIAAAAALGAVLLAAGVLVVVRRRRRDGEPAA